MKYLTASDVLFIHSALIDETGGSHGIRDSGLLSSAVASPQQAFEKRELYPTLELKAAALLAGLVKNHPFTDGNKRTALTATGIFLELNGKQLIAEQKEVAQFIFALASDRFDIAKAAAWLASHLR